MEHTQNILVLLIVAAAAIYVIRAAFVACGWRKNKASGCGGCATCPSKSAPAVVEISLGARQFSKADRER